MEKLTSLIINQPAYVRYVFVDIVKFTENRSVEAQCDVVNILNQLIRTIVGQFQVEDTQRVLIPTGDGVAIALFEVAYDTHLRLALELLSRVHIHNHQTSDTMRQFQVRIGLNENTDNVIEDVNKRVNVAGTGISMAQRIMDKADASQILVGETVFQALSPREKYMKSFQRFETTGKHGIKFSVYQFRNEGESSLNNDPPVAFAAKAADKPKLTKFAAYYLAIANQHRDFLLKCDPDGIRDELATVLIAFLAEDAIERQETPSHEVPHCITWKAGQASFEEQFAYYDKAEFWLIMRLASAIQERQLSSYDECFERGSTGPTFAFASKAGLDRLGKEWPQMAAEFKVVASAA